ncbi:MAG: bifunctional adenosylcobinamide kinase/adenosylcobinamide-phosphate guanylyltransferase [candidate division NC10 bacterium]|nr:bifunctional adenosylcobinamide kinase/adenosylcobinamide-phosphate guanylyltransferase [candidate division NC10 bacterium]
MITLILGGARSGKSDLALRLAQEISGRRAFVATAQASDAEMAERIEHHRRRRGPGWELFEESLGLGRLLQRIGPQFEVIVVDCLTLWMGNQLTSSGGDWSEEALREELRLICDAGRPDGLHLILVSNEVGMGIVPDNPLARAFRDLSGWSHQVLAEAADTVYFCVAGLSFKLKG